MTKDIPGVGFEGKIVGLTKVRRKDGDWAEVKFQVQPNDALPMFLLPLGARVEVTVVLKGDDCQPEPVPDPSAVEPPDWQMKDWTAQEKIDAKEDVPEKPKRAFRAMPRSQQAALKCQDTIFQEWVASGAAPYFHQWSTAERIGHRLIDISECCATDYVRWSCSVKSRAEFDSDEAAGQRWDKMLAEFERDTGRVAEERG